SDDPLKTNENNENRLHSAHSCVRSDQRTHNAPPRQERSCRVGALSRHRFVDSVENIMKRLVQLANSLRIVLGLLIILLTSETRYAAAQDAAAKELAEKVTIRRDHYGVPHILADTEEAAAFGHGYSTAEDHVLVLGRLFLKARSEEAAYFGPRFARS